MIIFDLDGTLADCEHRRHFVDKSYITCGVNCTPKKRCIDCLRKLEKDQPDWQAFYEACDKDEPIQPTIDAFKSLISTNAIQIWSGRCESVRSKTQEWLECFLPGMLFVPLKMRPIGDSTPDEQLKERWLDEALAEGDKINFVFDDRPKVVRMWRRRGIFVFNCCQHEEEF